MENASKALIIAGAILLAIVIISLGLIVVNNTRNTVDTANLNEQEIQAFNAKFTAYEGPSVSGSRVNSLIQQVISTNQATADGGGTQFVTIVYKPSNVDDEYYYALTYNGDKIVKAKAFDPSTNPTTGVTPTVIAGNEQPKTNTTVWKDFASISTSVSTGSKHDVKLYYKNGMVKCIIVTKIS